MRGQRFKNILAENLNSALPHINFEKEFNSRKRLCWKCQKDKYSTGGHMKMFTGGPMKFICRDCMEAKAKL